MRHCTKYWVSEQRRRRVTRSRKSAKILIFQGSYDPFGSLGMGNKVEVKRENGR